MMVKITSEISGILFWYEVFKIWHVCVCLLVGLFLNWDIVALYTHKTSRESTCPIFSPSQGWKGIKKNVLFGLSINFSTPERVAPSRHLCAVLLGESWTWLQEDRVLAHCSGEASDSRGQPWMPRVDTQTSIVWNTSVAQCGDEWKGPFTWRVLVNTEYGRWKGYLPAS